MKKLIKNYKFLQLPQNKDYRYRSCQSIDKSSQSLYYKSYVSIAEDINKFNYDKLLKHKSTIDFAIEYIKKQVKQGLEWGHIVYPQSLNPMYRYYVYKHVKAKLKLKSKNKNVGSQKYWVPDKCIITYGFRDLDRASKYQSYIEFIPSYSKDDSIKMNLRMTAKAYKNRHLFYLDGFDLVFKNKSVFIRHISEQIVEQRVYNDIEKYISIDTWCNVHSALVDKRKSTRDEKGRPRFNEETKVVCALRRSTHNTKFIKNTLNLIKSAKNTSKFYEYVKSLEPAIKNKVKSIIDRDSESKIILFYANNMQSKFYQCIFDMFYKAVEDLCSQKGIIFEVQSQTIEDISNVVKQHKEKANVFMKKSKKSDYCKMYNAQEHLKWSEFMLAALLFNYPDFYPILQHGGKFPAMPVEVTDKKDSQVLRPERPYYPSWKSFLKLWGSDSLEAIKEARQSFLIEIKLIAENYLNDYLELQKPKEHLIEDNSEDFNNQESKESIWI